MRESQLLPTTSAGTESGGHASKIRLRGSCPPACRGTSRQSAKADRVCSDTSKVCGNPGTNKGLSTFVPGLPHVLRRFIGSALILSGQDLICVCPALCRPRKPTRSASARPRAAAGQKVRSVQRSVRGHGTAYSCTHLHKSEPDSMIHMAHTQNAFSLR